jgi:hypothetical protein
VDPFFTAFDFLPISQQCLVAFTSTKVLWFVASEEGYLRSSVIAIYRHFPAISLLTKGLYVLDSHLISSCYQQ